MTDTNTTVNYPNQKALSPEKAPAAEQLKAEILSIYAKFNLFDGTVHQRAALHLHLDGLLAKLATKAMPTQMIKTDRVTVEHSSSVDAVGGCGRPCRVRGWRPDRSAVRG